MCGGGGQLVDPAKHASCKGEVGGGGVGGVEEGVA